MARPAIPVTKGALTWTDWNVILSNFDANDNWQRECLDSHPHPVLFSLGVEFIQAPHEDLSSKVRVKCISSRDIIFCLFIH